MLVILPSLHPSVASAGNKTGSELLRVRDGEFVIYAVITKVMACEKREREKKSKTHTASCLDGDRRKKKIPQRKISTMWTVVFFPLQLTRCHSDRPHRVAGGVFLRESSHEMCYGVHQNNLEKVNRQEVPLLGEEEEEEEEGNRRYFFSSSGRVSYIFITSGIEN